MEIQELTELGEYAAVEVIQRNDVLTGGVYQLRQGQQRRIQVPLLFLYGLTPVLIRVRRKYFFTSGLKLLL